MPDADKIRNREVAPAEVADARETVRRFLSKGRFNGRFESLSEPQAGASPPSDDELTMMAAQVAQTASADPLAYAILGAKRSEHEIKRDLAGAFSAIFAPGPMAQLSVAERSALEAISLLTGRPALLVLDDDFQLPTGVWELLAPYRADLQNLLKAVARLELSPQYGAYAGTAFVVGPGLVMTNRHVLDYLYKPSAVDANDNAVAWDFIPDLEMTLDFKKECGSNKRAEFRVTGIASIFPEPELGAADVDLALLRVASSSTGLPWPAPVRIQSAACRVKEQALVCVAGYPDADEGRNDKAEMDRIFGSVYQVKRLSPGKITTVERGLRSFSHDCTTLGGNSGSCVFDLATNSVVGLHWGGDYLKPNFAVFLPDLFSNPPDPRLSGVNFQGD